MKRWLLTYSLVLGLLGSLVAQEQRIFELINQANELAQTEPQKSLDLIELALSLSYESGLARGIGYSHQSLGALNYIRNRYDLAVEHFTKALEIFREKKEQQGSYLALKYLGMAYDGLDSTRKALKHYEAFLPQAIAKEAEEDIYNIRQRLGRLYYNQGRFQEALDQYLPVQRYQAQRQDTSGMVETYTHLGSIYTQLNQANKALNSFQRARDLAAAQGDPDALSRSYRNLNDIEQQNNFAQELAVQQEALTRNQSRNSKQMEQKSYLNIGNLYLNNNLCEPAIPYFKNSINLAQEMGQLKPQANPREALAQLQTQEAAYEKLAEAYEGLGKVDSALANYKVAKKLSVEIQHKQEEVRQDSQRLAELLVERNARISSLIREMEGQKEVDQAQMERQQTLIYALATGLLLVLVSTFFIWRSNRARRRANHLLALKSLRSQMNPHFIFNSLNSINSFIATQDERAANKYLADFSRLMRLVMENSEQDFVPLAQEIEVLKLYLKLEHFRFQDKFSYTLEIDPQLDQGAIEIPPMLIQPYIENAIWHGLRYKAQPGLLRVSLRQDQEDLYVLIEDNGIGRARSQAQKTQHQQQQRSTGLKNTAERLRLLNSLYQRTLRVELQDLDPGADDPGTKVVLRLPLRT